MTNKSALFVCLGNICRSPIAEAVFKQLLNEKGLAAGWVVDSAATSRWEIGSPPDHRGQKCMKKHNIYQYVEKHRARQITKSDYKNFDYIFGMDDDNIRNIKQMAPKDSSARILKLGEYDDDKSFGGVIEDPYYGHSDEDFETVYNQCKRSCTNFLNEILK